MATPRERPPEAETESISGEQLLHAVQNTAESKASPAAESPECAEEGVTPVPGDEQTDDPVAFSMDFGTEEDPASELFPEISEGAPAPDDLTIPLAHRSAENPVGKGPFITSEELQSLGEVLGHFSGYEEEEPAELGVPSSDDLSSVRTELGSLQSKMEGLQAAAETIGSIKPLLEEIKSEVDVGHHRRDILTTSISALSQDMHEIRLQMQAASKSVVDSATSLRRMRRQLNRQAGRPSRRPMNILMRRRPRNSEPVSRSTAIHGRPEWLVLLVGFGLLPLGWAIAFYLRTGDLRMTLATLILANLAACTVLMFGRSRA